jgi:hypothetical protein
MDMDMPGISRSGDPAYIETHIVAVRFELAVYPELRPVDKAEKVLKFGLRKKLKALHVPVRGDHYMAVIVRVKVKHGK